MLIQSLGWLPGRERSSKAQGVDRVSHCAVLLCGWMARAQLLCFFGMSLVCALGWENHINSDPNCIEYINGVRPADFFKPDQVSKVTIRLLQAAVEAITLYFAARYWTWMLHSETSA